MTCTLRVLVASSMVASIVLVPAAAHAAYVSESEPNNSRQAADVIALSPTVDGVKGTLTSTDSTDWFAIDVQHGTWVQAGVIQSVASLDQPDLRWFDSSGAPMQMGCVRPKDSSFYATSAGRYFVRLRSGSPPSSTFTYSMNLSTRAHPEHDQDDFYPARNLVSDYPEWYDDTALGDVSGDDGREDLLLAGDGVSLYRQAQDECFGPREAFNVYPADLNMASAVDAGDLDGDGDADAAASTRYGVRVLRQDHGELALGPFLKQSRRAFSLEVVNWDGEGPEEMIVPSRGKTFLYTRSKGGWSRRELHPSGLPRSFEVAHAVGNRLPDLIVPGRHYIRVFPQKADHTLGDPHTLSVDSGADWPSIEAVAVGDVTGDGRPDVVGSHDPFAHVLNVFPRTRRGFDDVRILQRPDFGEGGVEVADVDADGANDIVLPKGIVYLHQDGTIKRFHELWHNDYSNDEILQVRDVVGNSRPDILVYTSVWENGLPEAAGN